VCIFILRDGNRPRFSSCIVPQRTRAGATCLAAQSLPPHVGARETFTQGGTFQPMGQPGSMSRLRDCWWGRRPEVEIGEEERTYQITVYAPGPGAKLAELKGYFRERWKEFVFGGGRGARRGAGPHVGWPRLMEGVTG
jgi:hypothetical protein